VVGSEGTNLNGRRIPREDVIDARAGWAGEGRFLTCGGGAASGLAGPEAERAARSAGPKSRKKFLN
jgi:hypothetical protein